MGNLNIPDTNLKRILIIGGGFGGINLAKCLKNKDFQIVLIDKNNYHTFQPLLYQVSTAGLEPDSIAYPLRNVFKGYKNFYFRLAEALKIDAKNNILETNIGSITYDHLVLATGSSTNYFGMQSIEKFGMPMKTVEQALDLRSLILQSFEEALLTQDLNERERLMNFAIVGAGPTGTELAGALSELKSHVLPKDYPDLDFRQMSIHLIEMAGSVLPTMSEKSSAKAQKYLESLGIQVWLNTSVKDFNGKTVFTNKKDIPASTLIWAAGVKGKIINGLSEGEDFTRNRYQVNEFNQIGKHSNIYAIGDVAAMFTHETPKGHPMLAQVAIQQGKNLGKNLLRKDESNYTAFKYNDLGTMATIGRNKAVTELYNKFYFQGFVGWIIWMGVHLLSLVGFRNRIIVLFNWIVNYFSYDRKIRLIVRPIKRPD